MADHRIEQGRQEFETLKEELRTELTYANNTIAQLTARQRDLENQIARITEEKKPARQVPGRRTRQAGKGLVSAGRSSYASQRLEGECQ